MNKHSAIVWFRNDLRLADNPSLLQALKTHSSILPVYIHSPKEEGNWQAGAASKWWLHYSLTQLTESLAKLGTQLIIKQGATAKILLEVAKQTSAKSVFFTKRYEPWACKQEEQIHKSLSAAGIDTHVNNANLLFQPEHILTRGGNPYKVFTAFWKTLLTLPEPYYPLPKPKAITAIDIRITSSTIDELKLLPRNNWTTGISATWQPGELEAQKQLRVFIKKSLFHYVNGRDRPDLALVSHLSPHLHFGEISPKTIWHTIKKHSLNNPSVKTSSESFLKELAWREFAHYLLYHFPKITAHPLRPEFKHFPWLKANKELQVWQHGKTGYPIVDAGMRQLWHTGWIHNRVRMIVASFLVKDLLISWHEGTKWFWDTLVDADLANNTLGWQWVAGCGADAAPYFRIFNPILQGKKFDPNGTYIRQWLPELSKLSNEWIHCPWLTPPQDLAAAKLELGVNYPKPIIDHALARKRALSALSSIKNNLVLNRIK